MSPVGEAVMAAVLRAAGEWAASPEGQRVLRELEQMIIDNLPGWEGAVLRGLNAFLPQHIKSIGLKNNDPGRGPG